MNYVNSIRLNIFIDFGTLLGAVRHKGFIPWDDDTDISLVRDEFEKLYQVLKNENHPYYKLISFRETKGYPYSYLRVHDIEHVENAIFWTRQSYWEPVLIYFRMMVSQRRKVTVKR